MRATLEKVRKKMYGEYDEMKRKIQQLTNELKVSTWSDLGSAVACVVGGGDGCSSQLGVNRGQGLARRAVPARWCPFNRLGSVLPTFWFKHPSK